MFGDGARCLAGIAAVTALACVIPAVAGANTITVDTNAGAFAVDGNCALREAISSSNEDLSVDECKTGDGEDRIKFDIAGNSLISVTDQLPDVSKPVTIDGTTQPGFAGDPVVEIDNGGGVVTGLETTANRVVIKGLAITDFIGEGLRIDNDRNRLLGNRVGLDAAGNDHGNGVGISLEGDHNKVGGKTASASNVISGNGVGGGVLALGEANRVQGNLIGTNVTGSAPLSNTGNGVSAGDGARVLNNTISGNIGSGVRVDGDGVLVRGNVIGLTASGTGVVANNTGVDAFGKRGTIGGSKPAQRNVISGNNLVGVFIHGEEDTGRNRVLGNFIGTDATGMLGRGNDVDGVRIQGSNRNVVGGDEPSQANVIADSLVGVRIAGSGADTNENVVSGNLIGTDVTGTTDLGNSSGAVRLFDGSHDNVIGGLAEGEGNLMRFTPGGAVSIGGNAAIRNSILGNSAYDNGEEVIDLAENGVTPNDLGSPPDTDTGPNHLQNFPELIGGDELDDRIFGSLDSSPDARFRIEFFASDQPDDAQRYVGAREIITNDEGHRNFVFHSSKNLPAGDFVTATATLLDGDDPGDTSELSDQADISVGP